MLRQWFCATDEEKTCTEFQFPARKSTSGARDFSSNHKVQLWIPSFNDFFVIILGIGFMPPMKKRPAQKPRPPLPKSTNSKYPIALGNYADFLQKEFQNPYPPTKPPLQLIPRRSQPQDSGMQLKSGQASNPYQNYYPKRHLKIEESPQKQKGELFTNFNLIRLVSQLQAREISRQITKSSCGFYHLTIFFCNSRFIRANIIAS